jgi:6-phosphogluconolactonase
MEKKIHIYPNKKELVIGTTKKITHIIEQTLQKNGLCHVVLAGGNTPREVYALLATNLYKNRVDWNRVHLYWGDERTVPPEHPDSNFGMAQQALLALIKIPQENVHRIRGEISPKQAAAEYAELLRGQFQQFPPSFDLVILGVGEDGHTASLFPGTDVLEVMDQPAAAVFVPKLNTWRVTLTLPVLNAAKQVVLLVSGTSKSGIIQRIMNVDKPTEYLPVTLVRPESGRLHWLLDAEAAVLINRNRQEE